MGGKASDEFSGEGVPDSRSEIRGILGRRFWGLEVFRVLLFLFMGSFPTAVQQEFLDQEEPMVLGLEFRV